MKIDIFLNRCIMLMMNVALKCILYVCLAVFLPAQVDAAVHLSVSAVDGGSTLQFGKVDGSLENTKAVRMRINTDDGKQYQVYQRLLDAPVNQQGNYLNQQVLETYTVSGSNASGTLYAQAKETLGASEQLVYTSSPDGQGDTVTLSYVVNAKFISVPGNYIGRIQYTARSLGAGFQDQAILNMTLDAVSSWKCSAQGLRKTDQLQLDSSSALTREDGVKIDFSGNSDSDVRVYQELQVSPQNEEGQTLPTDAVKFFITGEGLRNIINTPQGLGLQRQLIYKSRESTDQWVVQAQLNEAVLDQLTAGVYRGRMVISIESSAGTQEFPLSLEITIKPMFNIEVELPPQGVRFNKVLPTDPPQVKEVKVKVRSNLGKSYIVMQNAASGLVTPKGDLIKEKYFVFKAELNASSNGRIAWSDFAPVGTGEKPIFYSDKKGNSAEFKVIYRLSSYPEITAGDYGAPIVFSLGEM